MNLLERIGAWWTGKERARHLLCGELGRLAVYVRREAVYQYVYDSHGGEGPSDRRQRTGD